MPASETEMEDCLGCRLTGSTTLLGVGAYFLNERSKQPRHNLGQRRWLLACAGTFAAAGVWRATTHLFETPSTTTAGMAKPGADGHEPWYACEGCSRKARAWFGLGGKAEQSQDHQQRADDDK